MGRKIEDIESANQTAIAEVLGVGRKTVAAWTRRGCPRNADRSYDLRAVVAWRLDEVSASGDAAEMTEEDGVGVGSPALERYRSARAEAAELDVAVKRSELVPQDEIRDVLGYCARVLRGAGEQLQKMFGVEAQSLLDGAIDEFEETVNGLGETRAERD